MKAREERVLADRKIARSGAQLDPTLAACWEETLDPGPYDFGEQPIDWGEVLQGDRPITTLLGFRLESLDGVEPRDKQRFIEDPGMANVTFLLGEFDRVDCGVGTEIEVECPECIDCPEFGTT